MGRRIASPLVTVRDDPTRKQWNGQTLLGHYPVDDDGVLPQPITLVDKGFLRAHYMSRIPTKYFDRSNGHSRAGDGSAANVFVEAAETLTRAELERKLVELAALEDLDYGLVVEQMGGGGGFGFSFGGASSVRLPTPDYCYRLYADGRKEVIRGVSFLPASYRVLRDIVALGDDPTLGNTRQQGQLASVVAPSVLVSELELRRPREEFSKPPYSTRPDMK
jgi:predicted Zn-dependent protease